MSGAMLHGLGDCTPERNCGCIGAGDGRRTPSRAVIDAAEQAWREHRRRSIGDPCSCGYAGPLRQSQHVRVEVARAAEVAALRASAERMDDLSRDDIPLTAAFAAGAAAKRLDQWADELTDTDDRSNTDD